MLYALKTDKSTFAKSMEERQLKKMIKVNLCFVLYPEIYLYQVFNCGVEEWYIVTGDTILKLSVKDDYDFFSNVGDQKRVLFLSEDTLNKMAVLYFKKNEGYAYLVNKKKYIINCSDKSMIDLFYDAYKTTGNDYRRLEGEEQNKKIEIFDLDKVNIFSSSILCLRLILFFN